MKYIQFMIGIAILAVILFKVDLSYTLKIISRLNIPLLMLISLITVPQIFFKSLRWRYLLKMQNIEYSPRQSFIAYAKGIYFGLVTPGRAGELIKAAYLKDEKNVEIGEGFSGVFLDRLFDLYTIITISMFGLLWFSITRAVAWIFIAGAIILMPLAVIILRSGKIRIPPESFCRGLRKISLKGMAALLLITLGINLIFFTQCYLLSRLIDINASFMNIVFISSIAALVAVIPVSILGIGTREAAVIYFFGRLNISSSDAVVFSFLMFFSFYIIGAVVGFLSWNTKVKK